MDTKMSDSSPNVEKTKEDDGSGSSSLVKDVDGILRKNLSPFKSSPSTPLKRALRIARGRKLIKDELKVELETQHFNTQLALSSASNKGPILLIYELFESISFRFAFKGKVLCKYGTYKITNNSYPKFLKADLLDKEGSHTITFVVVDPYIPQLVESFQESRSSVDNSVKSDGESAYRLVIADGPNSSDKAMQIQNHIFEMLWESSLHFMVLEKRSLAVWKL
ncbi:hypothetical protein L7F22_018007 [Adiantum nelumboides]|nr:hypothetical protein [Adiantum nelumboides]